MKNKHIAFNAIMIAVAVGLSSLVSYYIYSHFDRKAEGNIDIKKQGGNISDSSVNAKISLKNVNSIDRATVTHDKQDRQVDDMVETGNGNISSEEAEKNYSKNAAIYYDSYIEANTVDSSTSSMHEDKIYENMMNRNINDVGIKSLVCIKEYCRLIFNANGSKSKEDIAKIVPEIMPAKAGGFVYDPGEGNDLIVYYARDNEALPRMPK